MTSKEILSAFETDGVPVDGGYTAADLRAIAGRLRIPGRSGMNKSELINAINSTLPTPPQKGPVMAGKDLAQTTDPRTTDPTAAGIAGDPHAADAGMFVAVGTDKATGRAIIALDAAAVDALSVLLDRHVNSDDARYPQDDDDRRSATVASAIVRPLLKLQGYL